MRYNNYIISPAATATANTAAAIAGDIIKYQGGHMMRNADARAYGSFTPRLGRG